jgi:hypothetical protein
MPDTNPKRFANNKHFSLYSSSLCKEEKDYITLPPGSGEQSGHEEIPGLCQTGNQVIFTLDTYA